MASGSQPPADVPAARSGGKILKARRTTARKTPYDRPTPPQTQPPLAQEESPSWISGLVYPAKFVAGGASKILSSFWNPKSWVTPSSSSSDGDSESEDDSEDDENPSDEIVELNQKGISSEKSETLHLIEQLLMLEHYSREERDSLIEIINSRVIDYSIRGDMDAGPSMTRNTTNNETPDIHNQAITEAKKWVAEKKFRSGLKTDLDNAMHALKSAIIPQNTEGEAGSPIDVAKSYMRTRPAWASPISHDNSLTQSPFTTDLFKERTPYSSGAGISFSSAKRDYLSAGSWNIQDEIRRVRSKATENMLSSHRSTKLASSSLENNNTPKYSLLNDINALEKDKPITSETPNSVDEIVNLAADGGTPVLSDLRTIHNDLPTEAAPSHTTLPDLEQYQGTDIVHLDDELEKEKDEKHPDERSQENDKTLDDSDKADKNGNLMTEFSEIPLVNNSQGSSNTSETRAVTRASRQTRRGKAKGK